TGIRGDSECLTCGEDPPCCATLYQDPNFTGAKQRFCGALPTTPAGWNSNGVSSINADDEDCYVKVYKNANYTGDTTTFNENCVGDTVSGDKIQSAKAYQKTPCCATLYQDPNFTGANQRFCGGLPTAPAGWNSNGVSSIKTDDSNCFVKVYKSPNYD